MAEKKSGLKKLFSKSNKDCCSVEIEEIKAIETNHGNAPVQKNNKRQKEAW